MAKYINKPGGVILHLKDGSSEHYTYGREVDEDALAEHQLEHLGNFTDGNRRKLQSVPDEVRAQLEEANQAAVQADLGQPNSTSSPVPSNYQELDENGAVGLIRALEGYPEAQAKIVLHEMVNDGRQAVLDAASDYARRSAEAQLEAGEDDVRRLHGVTDGVRKVEEGEERQVSSFADASPEGILAPAPTGVDHVERHAARSGSARGKGGSAKSDAEDSPKASGKAKSGSAKSDTSSE